MLWVAVTGLRFQLSRLVSIVSYNGWKSSLFFGIGLAGCKAGIFGDDIVMMVYTSALSERKGLYISSCDQYCDRVLGACFEGTGWV